MPKQPSHADLYHHLLSAASIRYLFSLKFKKAMATAAMTAAIVYDVMEAEALEEFRRLLAIKVFVVDTKATKISPSSLSIHPISPPLDRKLTSSVDHMWHAAVLDTELYADLQANLEMTLHHRLSGASAEEKKAHIMRRQTMITLYRQFFSDEPIGIELDDEALIATTYKSTAQNVGNTNEEQRKRPTANDRTLRPRNSSATSESKDNIVSPITDSSNTRSPDRHPATKVVNTVQASHWLHIWFRNLAGQRLRLMIKADYQLHQIMKSACQKMNMDLSETTFMHQDTYILESDTLAMLNIQENDEIDMYFGQETC